MPRHMPVEKTEQLTLAVTDIRYRAAIILSYSAGLRISETVTVKTSNIIGDRNMLYIPAGKGGTERTAGTGERFRSGINLRDGPRRPPTSVAEGGWRPQSAPPNGPGRPQNDTAAYFPLDAQSSAARRLDQ